MIDKLSSYKEVEQDHSGPMRINYIETIMQKTELNLVKSDLRGVTIGSLIDENDKSEILKVLEKHGFDSIEEYQKELEIGGYEENNPFGPTTTSGSIFSGSQVGIPNSPMTTISGTSRTISLKLRTQTLYPMKFNCVEDVEDYLLNILTTESEKNTISLSKKTGVNFNINVSKILDDQISGIPSSLERRIITKILNLSNLIATTGRIGPATHILVHPKLTLQYNNISTAGILLLTSDKIEENRVYVFRSSDNSNINQIYTTYNKTLDEYYIGTTSAIKTNCFTFEII